MWNVRLEDEFGKELDQVVAVRGFLPEVGDKNFLVLQFLDPWGDTTFNQLHMTSLVEEWSRLREAAEGSGQLGNWEAVRRLLQRCQKDVHTYIKFVGD